MNELLDNPVFGSTTLAGCGGGRMACLSAACFAALFHIMPVMVFSAHCLVDRAITSEIHSDEASIFAEPMEDCDILICPFVLFGTCSWGSQPHTAIITVWHFILIVGQYVITSGSTECLPEFNFKGTSHAFWCYLSVPQPKIYI